MGALFKYGGGDKSGGRRGKLPVCKERVMVNFEALVGQEDAPDTNPTVTIPFVVNREGFNCFWY